MIVYMQMPQHRDVRTRATAAWFKFRAKRSTKLYSRRRSARIKKLIEKRDNEKAMSVIKRMMEQKSKLKIPSTQEHPFFADAHNSNMVVLHDGSLLDFSGLEDVVLDDLDDDSLLDFSGLEDLVL